ncbi:SH3 domain-containing protein [Antarctobacter heliothermus]|uniref:SH3 domain-containing protein n=1 Tax=Antarctobacter heliothermus TaxID=74033 RepID=A0A239IBB9_9RHOB|nr:SH3 domain-containing protein [Antarctobacter heliothermus]SNS90353.1 SH3 domain-containing protein [Antarctobacter heliothermus]
MLSDPTHGYRSVIVMEGPGGSFGEALKIGKIIHENIYFRQDDGLMGVFVLKGKKCLSACAVAGAWAGRLLFLEHGGQLGFHLPFFQGEDAEKRIKASEMLDFAYDIAEAYNELLIEDLAHRELFRQAYKHRTSSSFFYIRTPLLAEQYGFSAVTRGVPAKPVHAQGIGIDLVAKICRQKFTLEPSKKGSSDFEFGPAEFYPANTDLLLEILRRNQSDWLSVTGDSRFTDLRCLVGIDSSSSLHAVVVRDTKLCLNGQDEAVCAAKKPERPSLVTNMELSSVLECPFGAYIGKRERTITRSTNAHTTATPISKVLYRLRAGDKVTVNGCVPTDDNQSVWYKITARNRTAWVSARFLK